MNSDASASKQIYVDTLTRIWKRAQEVILNPKGFWHAAKDEPASVKDLFLGYIMPLAAIPAICTWLGTMVFGVPTPFGYYRVGFLPSLVSGIITYVVTLVALYLLAHAVRHIAPKFGGSITLENALKWLGYAGTPACIAGVLNLVPALSLLAALAGFYSLYILITGTEVMTGVPQERRWPFLGATLVAAIIIGAVVAFILYLFSPTVRIQPQDGQIDLRGLGDALKGIEQNLPRP